MRTDKNNNFKFTIKFLMTLDRSYIGYLGFLGIDLFKSVLIYSNGAICLIKLLFKMGLFTVYCNVKSTLRPKHEIYCTSPIFFRFPQNLYYELQQEIICLKICLDLKSFILYFNRRLRCASNFKPMLSMPLKALTDHFGGGSRVVSFDPYS